MPGPANTFASTWTQFGKVIKFVNEVEKFGNSNAANVLDMETALTVLLEGVYVTGGVEDLRRGFRTPAAAFLSSANLRALFRRWILELARLVNAPELEAAGQITDAAALRRIREHMVTNAQTLNSRGMTIDLTATSTGTGTGSVNRLTVDKDNTTLECTGAEVKVFFCSKDQNTPGGEKHGEVFEMKFADAEADALFWTGTGGKKEITSLNARTPGILQNPSFEQGAVTDNTALTTTTQLTGWTATTAANWKTRSAAGFTYRGYPGDQGQTLWGLECTASDTIAQVLRTANPGARFDERRPYYAQVAWKRKGAATGNLTLHVGSKTAVVAIGTGVADVWNVLRIAVGQNNWPTRFNEADLDVKLVVDTLAVSTVVVDDVVLAPYENLDGTWWAIVGSDVPWLFGDTHTFTDVEGAVRALFIYWLWRAYHDQPDVLAELRGWFPTNNAGLETIVDPA